MDLVLDEGHSSFHAPFLVHGSQPNLSSNRRCGYTMRYMPASTRLERGGPNGRFWESHRLYLVRGEDRGGVNTYHPLP